MNLVDASIVEIHSEEIKKVKGKTYVEVEMTTNTWGRIQKEKRIFRLSDWEDAKEKMSFLT